MKSALTSPAFSPEQIQALIDAAPARVDDPDCAYDPNDATATENFWKNAIHLNGGGIAAVRAALAARRKPGQRGLGKRAPKIAINIRLSTEVLEAFKATGAGWQTKMDGALKDWLSSHKPA